MKFCIIVCWTRTRVPKRYTYVVLVVVYATADETDAYMFYRCFFSLFCFFCFFPSVKNTR